MKPRLGPTPVGQRNRAQTIPSKRHDGPQADEWLCPHCDIEGCEHCDPANVSPPPLPVVTVTPSSGWPTTDLIYRGNIYRYVGNLTWQKEQS